MTKGDNSRAEWQRVVVVLHMVPDEEEVLTTIASHFGISFDEAVDRVLDDWTRLVAGARSDLIADSYLATPEARAIRERAR